MRVLGITGGIGCGKSTVINILEENYHCYVINTDQVAASLMQSGHSVYEEVVGYFGDNILQENGEIDRKKLANRVFKSELDLLKLNSFTHPMVRKEVLVRINQAKENKMNENDEELQFIIVETALPYEARLNEYCDDIWYVTASLEVRKERLMESRNYTDEKINDIFNKQLSEEAYRDFCQHVIHNDTSKEAVLDQIRKIINC